MSTQEFANQEKQQGNNGWQNIGICQLFAIDKVPFKLQALYMNIVRYSFGYMQYNTPRWTQAEWANKIGISRPTFTDQIHRLSELNIISINISHNYMKEGGSEAFSYSPIFPKGYGKLHFKDENTSSGSKNTEEVIIYNKDDEI